MFLHNNQAQMLELGSGYGTAAVISNMKKTLTQNWKTTFTNHKYIFNI